MWALVDALPNSDAGLVYGTFNRAPAASLLFDNAATAEFCDAGIALAAAAPSVQQNAGDVEATSSAPRRKRRRRARSCKSKEEAEIQRMTHIAVERNRRRQMNEYLAVLRSLMPEAYVQRVRSSYTVPARFRFRVLPNRHRFLSSALFSSSACSACVHTTLFSFRVTVRVLSSGDERTQTPKKTSIYVSPVVSLTSYCKLNAPLDQHWSTSLSES
jgi:hypothetical protein